VNKVSLRLLAVLLPVAISVVLLLSPAVPNGRAQQPAATPTVHAHILLPVNPPAGWTAQRWADFRQQCQEVANKSASHIPLTRDEFEMGDTCHAYGPPAPGVTEAPPLPQRSFHNSPMPTPAPTPQPHSANNAGADPPAGPFGTPITGAGLDACNDGQPPDVAADVSPTQVVELTNAAGIWVSDKQGDVAPGYPIPLATFWAPESIPNGNDLTDTQIAYDPFAQRWLATTLSDVGLENGDLYFALSQTSDATGQWHFYKISDVCSSTQNGTYPLPDQPAVGYNQSWAAVELQCNGPGGTGTGSDQLILIPNSFLTMANPPTNLTYSQLTPPFNGARPARDISGKGTQNLFLAGSVVPASSTLYPFVRVTSVDANGNFINPGPNGSPTDSPGDGVPGTFGSFALAQHDSCGAGSNCAVSLQDARISSVVLQAGNDGHYYLLTSFHAGDQPGTASQAIVFIGQVDSFATTNNWTGWYWYGPTWWAAYPTITMDNDLDITSTFTTFQLNSNIYPNWATNKGFAANQNPPALGTGIIGNDSRGAYSGCSTRTSQRWGDYVSTVWDPNLPSPNESSGFWTVQEYSNGGGTQTGSNESTQITKLADPTPFFVGYSIPTGTDGTVGENECKPNTGCGLIYTAPSTAQFGDLLVAPIAVGGVQNKSILTLPTGWTLLAMVNHNGDYALQSYDSTYGLAITGFVAAYIYGSQPNDSGTYHLGIANTGWETTGFMVAYRGASTTIPGNYLLYGRKYGSPFASIDTLQLSSANNDSPAGETTLLNLFAAECVFIPSGYEDPDPRAIFGTPSGSPMVTAETPLTPDLIWLAADVAVPTAGGTYGAYTSALTTNNQYFCGSFFGFAHQLVIPE